VHASASPFPRRRSTVGAIQTRYDDLIARLREASQPNRPAPSVFAGYLENVRTHAYRVTDADVQALKDSGFTDDEIFEHTVSAAVAAGLGRLDAALAVLP
jgi:alkylhydroperoxidase family enzyme